MFFRSNKKNNKSVKFAIAALTIVSTVASNAMATCSVTISGSGTVGAPLTANATGTGSFLQALQWQKDGSVIDTELDRGFAKNANTVAGGNGYGSGSNQLAAPSDVAFDSSGNVFVLDSNNNRVQRWNVGASSGTTVAGGNGLGSAANQFFLPIAVWVTPTTAVEVSDTFNARVQSWPLGATTGTTVAGGNGYGAGANQLGNNKGFFVDSSGNRYIADADNNRVQRWNVGATSGTTVAGGNGYGTAANQFKNPHDVFVAANGNIYVSDRTNNRIQLFVPGNPNATTFAGTTGVSGGTSTTLNDPRGIWVDAEGAVYIADYFNNRIQKWLVGIPQGITVAGGASGSGAAQLNNPSGVRLDASGNLFVADEGNDRVQRFAVSHSINTTYTPTLAGTYRVTAVYSDGCKDNSPVVIVN